MMKITFDSKAFEKRVDNIIANSDSIAEEVVKNLGTIAHKSARSNAPVDTGALKQSITLEVEGNGTNAIAEIGSGLEYAPHLEYGTTSQAAQPYLRPALRDAEIQVSKVVKAVWNKYGK